MRPWIIMGSAAAIALFMVSLITSDAIIRVIREYKYGGVLITTKDGSIVIAPRPSSAPMRTTVEHPGGIELAGGIKGWSFTCVTLLSAPKTMNVGDAAAVETDLLSTADREKVDGLMTAAQHAADAINQGSAGTAINALPGLDPQAADAIRRFIQGTKDRQAATDTLPGSPIKTAHLTGPGFEITPDTPERQAVTANTPAIWRWTIKAVDAGERTLTVSYSAEVLVADQRVPQSLRTISRTVNVSVAPAGLLKQAADKTSSVKSLAENVSWFWTTLIFPAGMFLYGLRKWFKERHAGAPQPTSAG